MSDIVERLRREGVEFHEQEEAADEIERLRANEAAAIFAFRETNDIALEEIKRLRVALQQIADDGKNCADHCRRQARRALEPKP